MLSRGGWSQLGRRSGGACLGALLRGSPLRVDVASSVQLTRRFNLHEYQSMQVFDKFNVPRADYQVATTVAEVEEKASLIKSKDIVVKAQVLAGGRGKGKFSNGFNGGVHLCSNARKAVDAARNMLGERLITKQTDAEGKPCNAVMLSERVFVRRETYFAILMDRVAGGPVLVGSPSGGMNIEDVAATTPELIFKVPVDVYAGPTRDSLETLAGQMGLDSDETISQAADAMGNLYELFMAKDCTLVEINPFAETHDGKVLCLDAKLNFDDNAIFRQRDVAELIDETQQDAREVKAEEFGLNFIALDGNIGCLVNGAGLAMATMDVIKLHGGNPANFLDLGGGASETQVIEAFKLLNDDPKVEAVLVNIFGGIVRCDLIALGIIKAAHSTGLKKPMVVRLQGTNVNEALELIEQSGLRMLSAVDLNDAAAKVVKVTDIIAMASSADLKVNFELPI